MTDRQTWKTDGSFSLLYRVALVSLPTAVLKEA